MFTTTLSPHALSVRLHAALLLVAGRAVVGLRRLDDERGQTTAEYALVLLGAAAVALLLAVWATKSGKLDQLLDAVFDAVTGKVT